MFDVFIIERIREEEERRRREAERPRVYVPTLDHPDEPPHEEREERSRDRGVLIIDPDEDAA